MNKKVIYIEVTVEQEYDIDSGTFAYIKDAVEEAFLYDNSVATVKRIDLDEVINKEIDLILEMR